MSYRPVTGALVATLALAAPLAAQRAVVLNVNGGGYEHFINLNSAGAPIADFKPGYNLGASAGIELTRYVALHGDFTFARAQARGASAFAGADINRWFYGAHLEARYPLGAGWTPFAFAGGGAVTVEQANGTGLATFTNPAGMFGAGLGFLIPGAPVEIFAEGKGLVYKWDEMGFNRTQADVTYSVGLAYRITW
jgi:opacity protein-like surface antigen